MSFNFLDQVFFGNRILSYIIALLTLLGSILFVKIIIRSGIKRFKAFAQTTKTKFDDFIASILERILLPVVYLSCLYVSLKTLEISEGLDRVLNVLQLGIITFLVVRIATMLVSHGMNLYLSQKKEDSTLVRSLEGMLKVAKFLIWALALIVFLDNVGFKVSTMIAGLGIGGIAIAIAAQALLRDFFSYFSIVFDRPFQIDDFIIIGDFMGTVEYIGIKTTRIRSLGGEQVIFCNTDLTDSRVRNYKRMEKRRVLFRIGVTYQASLDQLKEIPQIIESVIKNIDDAVFDRAHFFSYGDFSLIFEIVYFVLSPDYNKYMDVQQEINFALKEEFEERSIDFAYPTQKVFVEKIS